MPSSLKRDRSPDTLGALSQLNKRQRSLPKVLEPPLIEKDLVSNSGCANANHSGSGGPVFATNKRKFADTEKICVDNLCSGVLRNPLNCGTLNSLQTELFASNYKPAKITNTTSQPFLQRVHDQLGAISGKTLQSTQATFQNKRRKLDIISQQEYSRPNTPTMEEIDSSYNSFNYWKQALPDIDSDLLELFGIDTSAEQNDMDVVDDRVEFNSFNFWRTPIPDLDMDIDFDHL